MLLSSKITNKIRFKINKFLLQEQPQKHVLCLASLLASRICNFLRDITMFALRDPTDAHTAHAQ